MWLAGVAVARKERSAMFCKTGMRAVTTWTPGFAGTPRGSTFDLVDMGLRSGGRLNAGGPRGEVAFTREGCDKLLGLWPC